jgi:hypothetical protein
MVLQEEEEEEEEEEERLQDYYVNYTINKNYGNRKKIANTA